MKKIIIFIILLLILCGCFIILKTIKTPNSKEYTIEELQDLRRVDDIVEPVYTQDCFPRTLKNQGVKQDCFERANLGDNSHCSDFEIKMIKEYYEKGQENDPLNDGNSDFCAD